MKDPRIPVIKKLKKNEVREREEEKPKVHVYIITEP